MLEDEHIARMIRGFRELIILHFLSEQPMHGYDINKRFEKVFGLRFPSSVIYPILRDMEEKDNIKSKWQKSGKRRKRLYHITDKGKKTLENCRCGLEKPAKDTLISIIGG